MRIPCLYGFVAAAFAAVTVNVSAQTAARVDSTKLTTVLQALASAVPQDDARAVAQNRTSTARITRDALPKAVQGCDGDATAADERCERGAGLYSDVSGERRAARATARRRSND